MAARALTPKQQRFCDEYLIDCNGTQAYRRAFGPKVTYHTASVQAEKLLRKPEIQAEIRAAQRELRRRTRVSAARVVRELALIAFSDVGDFFDLGADGWELQPSRKMPPEARRALAKLRVRPDGSIELKLWDKIAAIDKLCRILGLYKDLPPLEKLISLLPSSIGNALRRAIEDELKQDQPTPTPAG